MTTEDATAAATSAVYVTVEEDILNGVPEKDWARKVKAVLREKFPDGITVGNSEINIGGRTGRELTWSGTSRWLRANDPVAFADKYRTANNADELLLASTDYVNEGLDHPRRDDITDFSRGKVQFRIGDRDYTADVIVAALKDGRLMLYDITHLTRTEIQNRSQPRRSTNPSPGTASYTATDSDNSISALGDNVNARFSYDEELPRPVIAKQDLRRRLLDTFSVPPGSRAELGRIIEGFADKIIRSGRYTEQDRGYLFDKLYDAGVMSVAADPYYSEARNALVKRRMYVSDALKAEFGDDWNDFRKRAFAAGVYLTNDPDDMAPDMFETPDKASLSGLEGDALVTRVEDILASRLEEVSEPAAQTVATLYAAGYTEALPSGIPNQVTVTDKKTNTSETVELDAYQQQFFGQVWTETVGRAVNELVLMPEFETASPEDQAKMLSQIYRFANETAKAETVEKYSPPSTMAEAAEDIASGRTLAEWAAYDVLSDDVSGTFGKLTDEGLDYEQALDVAETLDDLGDDATSVERYLAVARMPLPEDEKELALRGVMTDSAYAKYETARSAGIDTLDYCEFLDRISDISGDGRQERVWALIDSMRLTNRQKDVLHLAAGYKDSTLSKTPWHN